MTNPTQLFNTGTTEYGERYADHLFEQYKLYVESAEKISDRRQNALNYFAATNAALLSLLGLSFEVLPSVAWARPVITSGGIALCIVFAFLIRSYKQLNSGKFRVIHEIEARLPLRPFAHEWDVLGRGGDYATYYPFSHVESYIPWVFGVLYLVAGHWA